MKKILGLDIGTTSIGWAVVETTDEKKLNEKTGERAASDINNDRIGIFEDAVGVRIIPAEEMQRRFDAGQKLNDGDTHTPTANRRIKRGMRKLKSRYKLRRDKLMFVLNKLGMKPDGAGFYNQEKKRWEYDTKENGKWYTKAKIKGKRSNDIGYDLYEIRQKAVSEAITMKDWGRILLHLNQWRGYSSDRFKADKEEATKKGDKEIFTATVQNIEGPIPHDDERYHRFKISFDDGNIGWQIRKVENKESDFIKNEICSYSYQKKNEDIEGHRKIEKEKEVDKTSYAYRKKEINDSIEGFIKSTNGTVGSFFFQNFYVEKNRERIRNNHVNRDWYEQEFEKIWHRQYPLHKSELENLSINEIVEVAFKSENIRKEILNLRIELEANGIKKYREATFEEKLKYLIKDKIIYYQRPWQQSKNKGGCRFEKVKVVKERRIKGTNLTEEYETYEGRTVIPRSHPLHQEFKIWQQINNVRLWHVVDGERIDVFEDDGVCLQHTEKNISEIKSLLYQALQERKSQSWKAFAGDKLNLDVVVDEAKKRKQNSDVNFYTVNFVKRSKKGEIQDNPLKGNTTKIAIQNIVKKEDSWFSEHHIVSNLQPVSNLQLLWELIYDISVSSKEKVANNIHEHFPDFSLQTCQALSNIKFDDGGMGQLSAKAIRRMLPLMQDEPSWEEKNFTEKSIQRINALITTNKQNKENNSEEELESLKEFIPDKNVRKRLSLFSNIQQFKGLNYWEAAAVIYGQHSKQGPKAEQLIKSSFLERLTPVKRHSLNNPVVEKIANETLSLVKDIWNAYDGFDEIRIELARELKASREEREQMWDGMQNNAIKTEWAKAMLRELKKENDYSHLESSTKSNHDKIKIIEDVVRFKLGKDEYEKKTKELEINPKEPTKGEIRKYLHWLEQNFICPYTKESIQFTDVFHRNKRVEIEHIIPKERYYDNSYSNKVITWTEINSLKGENGNRTAFEFIVSKRREKDNAPIKLASGKTVSLVPSAVWEDHIKKMFPKGRKQANLLRKHIPEDPINRQLKETQYINKLLKEKLGQALGSDKIWSTTGSVTDILRESWKLNEVMKELVRDRYENFKVSLGSGSAPVHEKMNYSGEQIDYKTGEIINPEIFPGFSKRLDHRHHALDAIIIASTKQWHIQYINTMNAANSADIDDENEQKRKSKWLKEQVCLQNEQQGYSSTKFKFPWHRYNPSQITELLQGVIISHKNTSKLVSPSRNKATGNPSLSIRGQIHNETLIGTRRFYTKQKLTIEEIVKLIFEKRKVARETLKPVHSFDELIKQIVFKERFQKQLLTIFINSSEGKNHDEEIKNNILNHISSNRSALFEWAYTFDFVAVKTGTDKSGTIDKLAPDKITDERISRYAKYRLEWINQIEEKIKKLKKDKTDDDILKEWEEKKKRAKNYTQYPIFYNAVYDVRIPSDPRKWVPVVELSEDDLVKIEYDCYVKENGKMKKQIDTNRVNLITEKLKQYHEFSSIEKILITQPIIIGKESIPVRKASQRNKTKIETLYPIRKETKTYVELANNFMVYVFENNEGKKEWQLLSFMSALQRKMELPATRIELLYPTELIPEGFTQKFTLAKNDTVFINPKDENDKHIKYSIEELNELLDWKISEVNSAEQVAVKRKTVSKNLWNVNIISDSETGRSIHFIQMHTADSITIPIEEVHFEQLGEKAKTKVSEMINKFHGPKTTDEKNKNSKLEESIVTKDIPLFENCIKVFTDKLGKKIVPYWEFPNGCWNKEAAKKLDLV